MTRRLLIIGAGPIGLEAALGGCERGFDVTVLEQSEVGTALRKWGSTRFFTPFEMNVSPRARERLQDRVPARDALLTGPEMVDQVLLPLAHCPPLLGRVHTQHRVVSVGRARMTRRDRPGHPNRSTRPFRVLAETPSGEHVYEADAVLDASGLAHTLAIGSGGQPAVGERAAAPRLIRHLGALEAKLPTLRGKRVLLVGAGHSAAHAALTLSRMAQEAPGTEIIWATRSPNRRPIPEVAEDPLPHRKNVARRANDLAATPPEPLRRERRVHIDVLAQQDRGFTVKTSDGRSLDADHVVGFTGYRPEHAFLSELALDVSSVSEGAGPLYRALSGVTDCLQVPRVTAQNLESQEPGFYWVGAKAYGRLPTFLLNTGLAQLDMVLDALEKKNP